MEAIRISGKKYRKEITGTGKTLETIFHEISKEDESLYEFLYNFRYCDELVVDVENQIFLIEQKHTISVNEDFFKNNEDYTILKCEGTAYGNIFKEMCRDKEGVMIWASLLKLDGLNRYRINWDYFVEYDSRQYKINKVLDFEEEK